MTDRLHFRTSDLILLLGISHRTAVRRMSHMRAELKKQDHQPVTVEEACDYLDLDVAEVRKRLPPEPESVKIGR